MVELLLHRGADVNLRNASGLAALHLAARGQRPHQVALLLDWGADSGARDRQGRLPADLANYNPWQAAVLRRLEKAPGIRPR